MAKKAKRKPETAAAGPAPINLFGPTQQRKIKKSKVRASEYTLSDGTTLTVTPMLSDIRRALKQYGPDGQPLYFLTLGNSIRTKAPKKLLRPAPKR